MAAMLNQPHYLTKERLENLFYWFDTKRRHYISKEDYLMAMTRKGLIVSETRLEEIFRELKL